MSMILADTNIGRVIQVEGLLKQMEELEQDHKNIIGEMHYSECWKCLKKILKDELRQTSNSSGKTSHN